MPFFFERSHYAAIRAILLAGDVQAKIVENDSHSVVHVELEEGSVAIWGNTQAAGTIKHPGLGTSTHTETVVPRGWSVTIIPDPSSDEEVVVQRSDVAHDAPPEDVARLIATWAYESEPMSVDTHG